MKSHSPISILFITTVVLIAILLAQSTHLNGQSSLNSYGSVFLKSTRIHNQYNPSIGGMGAIVFNHRLGVGAFGNGMVGSIDFNGNDIENSPGGDLNLKMGYGGLFAEYFIINNKYLRLSCPVKLGYGAVGIYEDETDEKIEKSRLLVLEPELHFDIRLGSHMAVSFQSSYRIGDVKGLSNVSDNTISGLNFGIGLKMISR